MSQSKKWFFSLLCTALLTTPIFAKDDARELLGKSFQQADVWTQGPVKLVAHMRMPRAGAADVNFEYTISWAGPDKWRAEWTANGFDQVTLLNQNKLSYMSNQPNLLVQPLQFESAIASLDGANPAGPYTIPPVDWQKAKVDTTKKKVNNVDAKCMAFGEPLQSYCVDPATGHMLSVSITVSGAEVGSYEYSDYATVAGVMYPQTIKIFYAKNLLEEGKITLTRGDKLDDKLFTPPDKSTSVDFASCADVDKNFTAPHLSKSAPPKVSDALKKAKKYGLVWMIANVGKDGSVQKATVLAGDPDLNAVATEAAQQYKYTPYMRCGQAVDFQQIIVVPFLPPPPSSTANQGAVVTK